MYIIGIIQEEPAHLLVFSLGLETKKMKLKRRDLRIVSLIVQTLDSLIVDSGLKSRPQSTLSCSRSPSTEPFHMGQSGLQKTQWGD